MSYSLPAPGDVIAGKYTVERLLGQGGMGAVFVVVHRITGKRLALKCLLPEHAENAGIVERFVREAQAAGRIQHRHVVDVFDVGRDGILLFIVMELLDGKPLSDLLHDVTLSLADALTVITRSMEGVAAAHAHGIVHRDLKPDNIFVCVGPSGRLDDPRVLDFGISKVDDGMTSLTKTGAALGTPYYMSLEQMSGQRDLDQRVDVYAMGVILYESIAGEPPHTAESMAALAIRVLTTPPLHLGHVRPDLPAGLADVVMKAIARDRNDRYPDMHALIAAVQPYIQQGASVPVPEGSGRPLRTPRVLTGLASNATLPHASLTPSGPGQKPAYVTGNALPAGLASAEQAKSWVGSRSAQEAAPVVKRRQSLVWVAGAAMLLAVGVALWLYQRDKDGPTIAMPPPVLPVPAPAVVAPAEPVQQPEPLRPAAAPSPAAAVPPAVAGEPAGEAQPATEEIKPSSRDKRRGKHAKPEPAAASTPAAGAPPAGTPTPEGKTGSVKGRAGEIAPEDF